MNIKKILLGIVLPIVASQMLLLALIFGFVTKRFNANHEKVTSALEGLSISDLSDEEVVQTSAYTSYKSRNSTSGSESGIKSNKYKDIDKDRSSFKCESIKGFKSISASQAEQATVELHITSSISSGEGKIAIIKNDQVVEYISFGENVVRSYEITEESLLIVKIICVDAKVDITVNRTITPNS